jgi:hypothetical protein
MFIVKAHRDLVAVPDVFIIVEIDEDWVILFVLVWSVCFNL